MATGPPGSAYAQAAARYREILARDAVQLKLLPTKGAVEDVKLLADRDSGVSVGFSQAGTAEPRAAQELVSLGTVFDEEVWVFCHCLAGTLLRNDTSTRMSIGPLGSATRPLALKIMALNNIQARQVQLFGYLPEEAARALLAKELDAVFLVDAWESPVVQSLARSTDITLQQFPRADAYVALDPTLSKVILPRGAANLAADRPPEDAKLIAAKTSLVVRKELHPALQYLLLRAAVEVHARAGMFHRAGAFPAPEEIDVPLSEEARDFYRSGPSFLQRSLPFWLAVLVQRLLILIVPVAGIIYPLWSMVPRLYRWQVQRRIFNIYSELIQLEREFREAPPSSSLGSRLDDLDRRVRELRLSTGFSEMKYNLSWHIRGLREQVGDKR
jgi:TRAP-type uncharacterized transport system substrate-binding protein